MRNLPGVLALLSLGVAVSACAPRAVLAQADPDSIHHRNDCRLAAQIITTGNPAPRREWALGIIPRCRDGGHAVAEAFRANRSSSDIAYLGALTWPAIRLRDRELYTTALDIAADRSASTPARIFAIRTLIWSMFPGGGIDYYDLVDRPGMERTCGAGPSTHTLVTQGTPLPPDYVERAKTLANRLNLDSTEVFAVRRAAVCLAYVQPWAGLPR